jgi:hypothetical protein
VDGSRTYVYKMTDGTKLMLFANFLFLPYAILTPLISYWGNNDIPEVDSMSLGQAQYFYTVELTALEEHLTHSMDRVARLREKAMKRNDFTAADQINQLQMAIDVAQRHIVSLK